MARKIKKVHVVVPLCAWLSFVTAASVSLSAQTPIPTTMTLEQAEELLISRSLPVIAARQQIDVAEAARRVAGLRTNPNLQISAEQLPFYSNLAGGAPNFYRTTNGAAMPTYTAELGQLFERGNKRQLRSEQAQYLVDSARAQSVDVLRDQLFQLRQAFTAALLAKANLDLAEETDKQYAETERLMQIRLKGGEIAEVDVDRVRAARLPFLQAVLDARLAYETATKQVIALLGSSKTRLGPQAPTLSGDLDRTVPLPPVQQLIEMAIKERPDLKSAESQQQAAEVGTRLAESQRKRDIYGAMLVQRTGQDYAVGGSVQFPLFVFNKQKEAIAQATASQRVATSQVNALSLQVESDVERAYETVQSTRQALGLYTNEVLERSRSIRSIITYSYQRGEADLLEVLDAQRSANQILTGYNQARAAYLNAFWNLQYAVGRAF
jgi:cobalt-zinc-cadmium efflux system outer membrane protein